MTRAEAPTVDSWVHLAQTRKPPLFAVLFFIAATFGAAYMSVLGGLQALGITPIMNESASDAARGLGMIVMAAIAFGCGYISWLMIGRTIRNGSFGARPSGVALGENGVIVRVPGRDAEIPWTEIRSVEPVVRTISERHSSQIPLIELKLDPHAPIAERLQYVTASGYIVPGDALYTALRWYYAHPSARWELGRVEGERRIEGWVQDAVNLASSPIG